LFEELKEKYSWKNQKNLK